MKFTTLCVAAIFGIFAIAAADETASLGGNYVNDIFYHLEGRAKSGSAVNADWDIAFETTGFTGAILASGGNGINGSVGATLWATNLKGISEFGNPIDTAALFTETPWYNSHESWHIGAFNMDKNAASGDFGWGIYNPATHDIIGTCIYVIKLPDGSVRKIFMDGLTGDDFTFRYANIDGSDEQIKTFKRSEYAKKNFVYFSVRTGQFIDREPESSDWHLVFGKYLTILTDQGNAPYSVTGARTNNGVKVAKYKGANPSDAMPDGLTYAENITAIGHDWKTFTGSAYSVAGDIAYFVQIPNGKIFKIIFTSFAGASTGNIGFSVEDAITSVREEKVTSVMSVFPNPAFGVATIAIDTQNGGKLVLTDAIGRIIKAENVSGGLVVVDFSGLLPGVYNASINLGNSRLMQRVIIQ